jgi:hypothetical protein
MLTKNYMIGSLFGLKISFIGNVVPCMLFLWAVLSAVAYFLLDIPPALAILGGLLGTVAHALLELFHQFGHASAARKTGYPMKGVRYWMLLAGSIYPKDEPELPAKTHIRRALGGPIWSTLLTLVLIVPVVITFNEGGDVKWLFLWVLLDNIAVFNLGVWIPLESVGIETDASTILRYWPQRNVEPATPSE